MLIGLGIAGPSLSSRWSGTLSLVAAIAVVGIFAAASRPKESS
jgi:hypothetical protein